MTLTDIGIKRLTEDVTLDLIIDALENIKPIKSHHEAHRIPILNGSNGNIVTPTDRTLRAYRNPHRDLSQYTEITRQQAHSCITNRYTRLFDFYNHAYKKYTTQYKEARYLFNALKQVSHQALYGIETIYEPIKEYNQNFYIQTTIDHVHNNIFVTIKINKLSHKDKFIVGSKPEFESFQQNHPFEHIRNCPTYEYSTDILFDNIIEKHPYDYINILIYTIFSTYAQLRSKLKPISTQLDNNNFKLDSLMSRKNTLRYSKL